MLASLETVDLAHATQEKVIQVASSGAKGIFLESSSGELVQKMTWVPAGVEVMKTRLRSLTEEEVVRLIRTPFRELTVFERFLRERIARLHPFPLVQVGHDRATLTGSDVPLYVELDEKNIGKGALVKFKVKNEGDRSYGEYSTLLTLFHVDTNQKWERVLPLPPMKKGEEVVNGVTVMDLKPGRYKYSLAVYPKEELRKALVERQGLPEDQRSYGVIQVGPSKPEPAPIGVASRFEALSLHIETLWKAETGVLALEQTLAQQKAGLLLESAYLDRSLKAGPLAVAAQFGNRILGEFSGTTTMKDVERVVSAEMYRSLEAKIDSLNGDKPEKRHGFLGKVLKSKVLKAAIRPFTPPVDLVKSIVSKDKRPQMRESLLKELSDADEMNWLEQEARDSVSTQFVSEEMIQEAQLLDLMMLRDSLSDLNADVEGHYKDVTATEALVAANQKVSTLMDEAGGLDLVFTDTWQMVVDYLELEGHAVPEISVTDLPSLRNAILEVENLLPENATRPLLLAKDLLTFVDKEIQEQKKREEALERSRTSMGRLENEIIPEARTHRDRLAKDLDVFKRFLRRTLPLSAEALNERYTAILTKQEEILAKKKEALSRLEIDLGRLEEGKVKLSEQKGESPTVQEVVGRVEQGLGDVREETSRFIILSTQEGRRAFDEKRYEEAKQSFNKAIALEPFHHTKAYLEDLLKQVRSGKRITDSTTTEEIVTTLESQIETAKKVEEALGDAKEYWLKTDEKLKKFGLSVGVITADKTTLAQADHFLAVAIGSLGVLRDEQLKKLGVESVEEGYWHLQPGQIAPDALKRAEAFQELVNKLFELRVRLSETKTGEDLSPLLLEAEKQLDSAYRSVNKFSLRVTGLN
ncbi:MAG: hypothetical protein HYS56_02870, partial [Candidatus Omnitrophica bacterium]|nr:hypothetical protein [Candidatus Omnitrophota bacterium]